MMRESKEIDWGIRIGALSDFDTEVLPVPEFVRVQERLRGRYDDFSFWVEVLRRGTDPYNKFSTGMYVLRHTHPYRPTAAEVIIGMLGDLHYGVVDFWEKSSYTNKFDREEDTKKASLNFARKGCFEVRGFGGLELNRVMAEKIAPLTQTLVDSEDRRHLGLIDVRERRMLVLGAADFSTRKMTLAHINYADLTPAFGQ